MTGRRHSTPRHPEPCRAKDCDALIWFKLVDGPAPKPLRLPLLAKPDSAGTVAASEHAWEHGRFLAAAEQPRDGEKRWRNHFDDCPGADAYRRRERDRRARGRRNRDAAQPDQLALIPAATEITP